MPLKTIDVENLNNITLLDTAFSNINATAHNPYALGDKWCWVTSYQDGVYLYNISNPSQIIEYGFFDTHPQHGFNDNYSTYAYRGNWGAYPYLPSKIIIATDRQNGIFILEGDAFYKILVGIKENKNNSLNFSLFPNPASCKINISLDKYDNQSLSYTITNVLGNEMETNQFNVNSNNYNFSINTGHLNNGFYFLTVTGNQFKQTRPFIIQN